MTNFFNQEEIVRIKAVAKELLGTSNEISAKVLNHRDTEEDTEYWELYGNLSKKLNMHEIELFQLCRKDTTLVELILDLISLD